MEDRQLELYFASIKEDFSSMEGRFDHVEERFDRLEGVSRDILELMQNYDRERKEVKATLWEHDRRLAKLERHT